jgi:uncharacterized membrane protein
MLYCQCPDDNALGRVGSSVNVVYRVGQRSVARTIRDMAGHPQAYRPLVEAVSSQCRAL